MISWGETVSTPMHIMSKLLKLKETYNQINISSNKHEDICQGHNIYIKNK